MPRKVFFSFHFDRDAWRVAQVRNSQVITNSFAETQFLDKAHWEQIRRQGDIEVKRWIDNQLIGTTCTIVLIGNLTSERQWVHYEIQQSWARGNGLLGIYIHDIRDSNGFVDHAGMNPLDQERFVDKFGNRYFPKVYNWVSHDGRNNVAGWIEQAIIDRK
ncbi:MAG: TIR domain-containing protein [Mucilaginibacter sp.]